MAGLIPVGGGGDEGRLSCFNCGEPAAGPCAFCHVMICSAEACSAVVEEPGLSPVVLCRDCARRRPLWSSRRWTAPVVAIAGLILLVASIVFWAPTLLIGAGIVGGAALLLLAVSFAIARWQWRHRLRSARR